MTLASTLRAAGLHDDAAVADTVETFDNDDRAIKAAFPKMSPAEWRKLGAAQKRTRQATRQAKGMRS